MRESNAWKPWGWCIGLLVAVAGCGFVGDDPGETPDDVGSCAVFSEAYGSEIESDTTVTAEPCLRVEESVKVGGGAQLTIEPGARLYFAEKTGLYVSDAIFVVDGKADAKVLFSGTEKMRGWWSGVTVHNTDRAANKIAHAVIEYAGHESGIIGTTGNCLHCTHHPSNLQLQGNRGPVRIAVTDTVVRESAAAGMYADENANITSFENNELTDNAGPSADIHPWNIGQLGTSSTFGSEVEVHGGTIENGGEHVWPAIDARYRVSDNILIKGEDTRIDIEAGGTYAFEEQKYFALSGGVLSVNGESGDEVRFTGTEKMSGWWSGITLHNTDRAANKIAHAVIEYGGNDRSPLGTSAMCLFCANNPANLQLAGNRGPVQIALEAVELNGSSALGLFADDAVNFRSCSGLVFDANTTDWGANGEEGESQVRESCSL